MIDIGPVPRLRGAQSDMEHPIARSLGANMDERKAGGDLEIGSYAHRPILYDPEDLPPVEQAALSPTEFPFTQADFDEQMQHALELMPEIVGDESVGVKYAINGILSLTPDGMPVLGESPDVKGLWAAAAVWVKEGPGTGRSVAEWMIHGESEIDLHSSDIARFHEHQKTRTHVRARAAEGFNKTYGIVHPSEQWASNRNIRLAPFHVRERELGVVFTPVLSDSGGFKSDLTIMRLGDEHFRVVTGGAAGMSDKKWFRDQLVRGAELADMTSPMTTIGLWGPRARDILAGTTSDDVSNEAFKFGTCRTIEIGTLRVLEIGRASC